MFAAMPSILTPAYIMDIFFLHQRGRAFICLEISLLSAFTVSPTLGGFIAQTQPWPTTIWWTLAPIGLAVMFVFTILEETGYSREEKPEIYPAKPASFVKNRIATLLPGPKIVPATDARGVVRLLVL